MARDFYRGRPFVRVTEKPPHTKWAPRLQPDVRQLRRPRPAGRWWRWARSTTSARGPPGRPCRTPNLMTGQPEAGRAGRVAVVAVTRAGQRRTADTAETVTAATTISSTTPTAAIRISRLRRRDRSMRSSTAAHSMARGGGLLPLCQEPVQAVGDARQQCDAVGLSEPVGNRGRDRDPATVPLDPDLLGPAAAGGGRGGAANAGLPRRASSWSHTGAAAGLPMAKARGPASDLNPRAARNSDAACMACVGGSVVTKGVFDDHGRDPLRRPQSAASTGNGAGPAACCRSSVRWRTAAAMPRIR